MQHVRANEYRPSVEIKAVVNEKGREYYAVTVQRHRVLVYACTDTLTGALEATTAAILRLDRLASAGVV